MGERVMGALLGDGERGRLAFDLSSGPIATDFLLSILYFPPRL
jgi:hypothetical protein